MKYIGQYSSPEDIATLDNVRSVEILATDASNLADSAKNALAEHVDDTNIHVTLAEKTTWNGKQDKITGAATTITDDNLTANRALVSNSSGKVAVSIVTSTEFGYLDGVTSNVQTQLNGKQPKITVNGIIQGDGAGNLSAAELNPASVGLGNVDNVKQYSASNPPPYPVTSVNGHTGAVTVHEVPVVTTADNGKFLRVVNGAWTAAAIADANGGSF